MNFVTVIGSSCCLGVVSCSDRGFRMESASGGGVPNICLKTIFFLTLPSLQNMKHVLSSHSSMPNVVLFRLS